MRHRADYEIPVENRVVWMTCGLEAGYQIVLAPRFQQTDWAGLLETAFPLFEIGRTTLRWKILTVEDRPALAVAFFDPEHCDASSRPIKHFLLFLHIDEKLIPLAARLNAPQLLAQLAPGFELIHRAGRHQLPRETANQIQNTLGDMALRLSFSAKPAVNPDQPVFDEGGDDDGIALRLPAALRWMIVLALLAVIGVLFNTWRAG